MLEMLATLALSPWLIGQGLYTRAKTPRLPEAKGPREGLSGEGSPLKVLVLGDSAAAGVGVRYQSEALSGRLAQDLGKDFSVAWKLLAQTGRDAGEVLALLEAEPEQRFDVAVLSVGVNDVTGRTSLQTWDKNLHRLHTCLTTRFGVRHVFFSPIPPMHAFPALPQPLRWWLGRRARHLNQALAERVSRHDNCTLLAGDYPIDPNLMAADGFHPGEEAYSLWASEAAGAIRRRIWTR
ncbi:SGNH/GDSL hydrolase family protein [Marinobacter sp. SS21]|uniref:SGNH/GDSL hydrolase family protein n=1 Tax=Marinobacter sp. SS21 TaxID=2979460 RepID=UPI00232CFC19|nr:SGNH/GDSL hydrolase family protein [Marinobacter sp. SS21]MDC0663420.1 SGNH/GDSL hydrolase family protein [Marinobacter sp. SS21]